jgi:hypothetical protein
MSDLQLSLFPAVVVPVGPTGSGRRPSARLRPADPLDRACGSASLLDLLPRRIPAEGVEVLTSVLGTPIHCRMRRSDRARQLRLVVDRWAGLTLVLPRRFPVGEVPAALEQHARWIVRTVERARIRARQPRPRLDELREVSLFGARHGVRVVAADTLSQPARVWRSADEILVRVPPLHPRGAGQVLRSWLRAHATREIPARVQALNGPLGFPLRRVTVRDQRTKWGACSASGSVSINWRLALGPPDVLDYVILHELCHLRELNHSSRFWRLLSSVRPDYERQRAWLKEHGDELDL